MAISSFILNGLSLQTGDLICTVDGDPKGVRGKFWGLLGKLLPGQVDHVVIYVGPGGRCVEAGPKGKVITFEAGERWDAEAMFGQRGFVDVLYGVAYPLANSNLPADAVDRIRTDVAQFCLDQVGKPYNVNFLDPNTDAAFYCSQLAYMAYQRNGINIRAKQDSPDLPLADVIVYPQQVWNGCQHERAKG